MFRNPLRLVLSFIGLLVLCNPGAITWGAPRDINSVLPERADLKGWALDGQAQSARGDDLFRLINGGADVFLKIGFQQAVIATYKQAALTINLEIFEMKDEAAATRIYREKVPAGRGIPESIGQESSHEEYYLIFRKGRFLVTLTGFDTSAKTKNGLKDIGRLVEKRLE